MMAGGQPIYTSLIKSDTGFVACKMGRLADGVVIVYPNGVDFQQDRVGQAYEAFHDARGGMSPLTGQYEMDSMMLASNRFVKILVGREMEMAANGINGDRPVYLTHELNYFRDKDRVVRLRTQPQPVAAAFERLMESDLLVTMSEDDKITTLTAAVEMLKGYIHKFRLGNEQFSYNVVR